MAVSSVPPPRSLARPVAPVAAADDPLPVREPAHTRPEAPRPTVPKTGPRPMFALHRLLEANRFWYWVALRLESSPRLYRAFTRAEEWVKGRLFGCRMCAQCALPSTAYACPMTCPKQLRNGPCGGVAPDGSCEVYPGLRCVWLVAYERAEREGRVADLRRLQRPLDQRKWGESSWVNYWLGRDRALWTPDDGLAGQPPPLHVLGAMPTPAGTGHRPPGPSEFAGAVPAAAAAATPAGMDAADEPAEDE